MVVVCFVSVNVFRSEIRDKRDFGVLLLKLFVYLNTFYMEKLTTALVAKHSFDGIVDD